MIVAIALVIARIVTLALTFGRFARSDAWRATVTPLASIIGSGFLICGPILAREFGSAALLAELSLKPVALDRATERSSPTSSSQRGQS